LKDYKYFAIEMHINDSLNVATFFADEDNKIEE